MKPESKAYNGILLENDFKRPEGSGDFVPCYLREETETNLFATVAPLPSGLHLPTARKRVASTCPLEPRREKRRSRRYRSEERRYGSIRSETQVKGKPNDLLRYNKGTRATIGDFDGLEPIIDFQLRHDRIQIHLHLLHQETESIHSMTPTTVRPVHIHYMEYTVSQRGARYAFQKYVA